MRLDADSNGAPASLSLFDARFRTDRFAGSDTYWMECQAKLDADGESTEVALSMIQPYREDTLAFFEKLSSMPNGWPANAEWSSEHGEIRIEVQGRGSGLVALQVELRRLAHLEAAAAAQLLVGYDDLRHFMWSLGNFLRVPHAPSSKVAEASQLGRWSFTDSREPPRRR